MKKINYAAVFAAIAVAGFSGFENFPFLTVSACAQEVSKISEIAKNFSPEKNLDLTGTQLVYKNLPAGVKAKIIGTTYEQLISFDGKIRNPLSPKTTKVTFELTDAAGNKAGTPTFEIAVPVAEFPETGVEVKRNGKPAVVPALQEWIGGEGCFVPSEDFAIIVPEPCAKIGNPTLRERAGLFASELSEIFGRKVKVLDSPRPGKKDITLDVTLESPASANLGKEGYVLAAMSDGLHIIATDPLGAFWGTRSVLQVFKQNNNTFPCGIAVDYPQYPLRGFMYDLGRKPASLKAVKDVLKTMAYYKMNDYHLHLNDNFIWMYNYTQVPNGKDATPEQKKAACEEVLAAAPTAFRLESDVVGNNGVKLTADDLYYTKKEFGELIDLAKLYGVTVVPEFDVPGHAMSFVRVRPDLMYRGKVTKAHDVERTAMLDASDDVFDEKTGKTYREETLDFVQSVFDEYLVGKNGEEPVFRTPVIHFGTDEYYGDPEDYRAFADAMIKYVKSRGYTPRLWGSLSVKKGKTPVDGTGAQINVWNHGWQNPLLALEHNFDLVNIIDVWAYVVPNGNGNRGGYGDLLDLNFLYSQNWHPHKMSHKEEVIPGFPKMLGASWAVWNDNSFCRDTGLTDYDLFDRIRQSCAVIAEKTWNTGEDVSFRDFQKIVKNISYAPLSNPEYLAESPDGSDVLFELKKSVPAEKTIKTGIEGLAPNFIADLTVMRTKKSTGKNVLFSGPSGDIFVDGKTGTLGITRDTWEYAFPYALPLGKTVKLQFVADKRTLTLYANGEEIGAPVRKLFPDAHKFTSFVFPLEAIRSSSACEVKALKITRISKAGVKNAVPENMILDVKASSEHGKGADGDASALWDGDDETYWHSKYETKGESDKPPFEIEISFKQPLELNALKFLPRQNGDNGNAKHLVLSAKTENGFWKRIAEFRESNPSREMKTLKFPKIKTGALRLVILDGVGGYGSMAEIYPISAK